MLSSTSTVNSYVARQYYRFLHPVNRGIFFDQELTICKGISFEGHLCILVISSLVTNNAL